MTREEIKQAVGMRDVLARYGLQANRAGFIKCPFHLGDREASLKVYERDFNCFGCGANGDIFDFVMRMEHCSFPDAFRLLGGTYKGADDFSARLAVYKSQKAAAARRKRAEKAKNERRQVFLLVSVYRRYMGQSEPLSDVWCDCYNALQIQLLRIDEMIEGKEGQY